MRHFESDAQYCVNQIVRGIEYHAAFVQVALNLLGASIVKAFRFLWENTIDTNCVALDTPPRVLDRFCDEQTLYVQIIMVLHHWYCAGLRIIIQIILSFLLLSIYHSCNWIFRCSICLFTSHSHFFPFAPCLNFENRSLVYESPASWLNLHDVVEDLLPIFGPCISFQILLWICLSAVVFPSPETPV